jgi:hypothetical protein
MPLYPKVLRARERTPTPFSSVVFTFGLAIESIKELWGALDNLKHKLYMAHNLWEEAPLPSL